MKKAFNLKMNDSVKWWDYLQSPNKKNHYKTWMNLIKDGSKTM